MGYIYSLELVFLIYLDIFPEVELLDYKLVPLFNVFEEAPYCFPQWLHQSAFLPSVHKGSPFSISAPAFVVCCFIDDSHSAMYEVVSHCGFDLHLSVDY